MSKRRIIGSLKHYRIYIICLALATLIQLSIRAFASFGFFSTQDEWVQYARSLCMSLEGVFPRYEPFLLPLQFIAAPPGIASFMTFILGFIPAVDYQALSLLGGAFGSLTYFAAVLLGCTLFSDFKKPGKIALMTLGFLILSPAYLIRMQLFLGETFSVYLFFLMLVSLFRGKLTYAAMLLLGVGLIHEFMAFFSVCIIFLASVVYSLVSRTRVELWKGVALSFVGAVPELMFFMFQPATLRTSDIPLGFFPYRDISTNIIRLFSFLGAPLLMFGIVGFLFFLWRIRERKLMYKDVFLVTWYVFATVYAIFPPFLPAQIPIPIWRMYIYYSIPAAVLSAYLVVDLARAKTGHLKNLILVVAAIVFSNISIKETEVGFSASFLEFPEVTRLLKPNNILLVLGAALLLGVSACHALFNDDSKERWRLSKLVIRDYSKVAAFALMVILSLNHMTIFAPTISDWYVNYYAPEEIGFISGLRNRLEPDAIVATNFVLAASAAGLTQRKVKCLPPCLDTAQEIFSSIVDPFTFVEKYRAHRGIDSSLPEVIYVAEPLYLLALAEGGSMRLFSTYNKVIRQLSHDTRFGLIDYMGSAFLFKVYLDYEVGLRTLAAGYTSERWYPCEMAPPSVATISVSNDIRKEAVGIPILANLSRGLSIPSEGDLWTENSTVGWVRAPKGSGDVFEYNLSPIAKKGRHSINATLEQVGGRWITTQLDFVSLTGMVSLSTMDEFLFWVYVGRQHEAMCALQDNMRMGISLGVRTLKSGWNLVRYPLQRESSRINLTSVVRIEINLDSKDVTEWFLIDNLHFGVYDPRSSNESLKLSWYFENGNVNHAFSFSYSPIVPLNLGNYTHLGLWVYGNQSFDQIQVYLVDDSKEAWGEWSITFVDWSGWKLLMFPLASFDRVLGRTPNLSRIERVIISITVRGGVNYYWFYWLTTKNLKLDAWENAYKTHSVYIDQLFLASIKPKGRSAGV